MLRHSRILFLLAGVSAAGCTAKDARNTGLLDSADSGGSTGGTELVFGPEDVDVSLTATGVDLVIRNNTSSFFFGMAPGCDGTQSNCWVGESCVEDDGGYEICHAVGPTGGTLQKVDIPSDVVAGSTTLFGRDMDGQLGFVLMNDTDCYAFGPNASYYTAALSCTAW